MKTKKIIALLAGATMIFSSMTANAAFYMHQAGIVVSDTTVTKTDVENRPINVEATATHLTYAEAETAGLTNVGNVLKPNILAEADYDFYKVEMNYQIGDLFDGLDLDTAEAAHLQYYNTAIYFDNMPQVAYTKISGSLNGTAHKIGYDTTTLDGGYAITNANTIAIPTATDVNVGALEKDYTEGPVIAYFTIAKTNGNATVIDNISVSGVAGFHLLYGDYDAAVDGKNIVFSSTTNGVTNAANTLRLAPVESKLSLTINDTTLKNDSTATVWEVAISKAEDDITEFNAVFTDTNNETAERTIKTGLADLNTFIAEGEGSTNIYVALQHLTGRVLKSAKFEITDGTNTVDDTWPAAN